ncbi:hypothetical protein QQF64_001820 [Cirrhinus molitorella]|uniref:Uncharacterized protein n=1 Tax=Cirrhinus molitorella TaxID=172907 RepID=A0ABR3MND7_9TELE
MVHYAAAENDHLCAGTRGHLSRQQLMAPSAPLGPAWASQLGLAFICVRMCVCDKPHRWANLPAYYLG